MRMSLLSILRSPLTGAMLHIQSAAEWYSDNDLKTGILESTTGELFPVLTGIPILTEDGVASMTLQHIQSGSADAAVYNLLNGQPLYWVENPKRTFQQLLYQFVGRWSADYFYYRRSDPTFLAGLSLLRVGRGQTGWVFDLACGCGHYCDALLNMLPGHQVVGADSTFKLLYLARHFIAPQAEYVCCDIEKGLPFSSDLAGLVLCSDIFAFLTNKWGSVREMIRLLQPNGRLLITRLLKKAPVHWNSAMFRFLSSEHFLLSLEHYMPMFEPLTVQIFGDQHLREVYVQGGSIIASPGLLVQDQSCSIVISRNSLPENAFVSFMEEYPIKRIYLNPLYNQVGVDSWRLIWPSQSYAQDYEAASVYLPADLHLSKKVLENMNKNGQLEDWLRKRIFLILPDSYSETQSPIWDWSEEADERAK